jgi:hypothetical protein
MGVKQVRAAAAAAVSDPNEDNADLRYDGSFSILHEGAVLNLTASAGLLDRNDEGDPTNLQGKLGWLTQFFSVGQTAFGVDYTRSVNLPTGRDDGYSVGVAAVQQFEALPSVSPVLAQPGCCAQCRGRERWHGRGQGEMIYAEADRAFTVALDFQMPIEEMVATWNLNAHHNLVWGPLGCIDSSYEAWFYRTFEHSDRQRRGVGFMVEWGQIYEDPWGRPCKVLFGYYCGAGEERLADQEVRALIRGFSVRMRDTAAGEQQAARLPDAASEKPSAINAAGGDEPSFKSGNPGFPFMFARSYSMNHGGRLN